MFPNDRFVFVAPCLTIKPRIKATVNLEKSSYKTPRLTAYGTIREITLFLGMTGTGDNGAKSTRKTGP